MKKLFDPKLKWFHRVNLWLDLGFQHAKTRVSVEHAIGGMKAFHCLTHRIRNHLDAMIEYLFWIPAGL
ncbi:MAG: hypothetical protein WCH01_09740 [Methylococcaceae bacterium]